MDPMTAVVHIDRWLDPRDPILSIQADAITEVETRQYQERLVQPFKEEASRVPCSHLYLCPQQNPNYRALCIVRRGVLPGMRW